MRQRASLSFGLVVALVLVAGFGASTPTRAQAAFTCTEIVGFSQTMQWFYGAPGYQSFESLAGQGRWQLRWEGGADVTEWANPSYYGWGSGSLRGACAQGSGQPDRVLYNVTGDYQSDVNWWVQQIRAVITNIRNKYPNARQIILQSVVGGPGKGLCSNGGQTVRASYNSPYISQAISQLVGAEVVAGMEPEVRTCADYADWVGHLTDEYKGAMGESIGRYYAAGSSGATPTPTETRVPAMTSTSTPTPTRTPTPTNTSTPTPGPTATPGTSDCVPGCTLTFEEFSNHDVPLNGQYPTGVVDWGSNRWFLSGPWGRFTSNSVSFAQSTQSSVTFTYVDRPRRLIQLDAYNSGTTPSTVTLSCDGQPSTRVTVDVGQIQTIPLGWVGTCRSVSVSSTNGWDTNFDNLVIDIGAATPTPTPTAATGESVSFRAMSNPERPLNGQYPSGVIDWGTGAWYLSGPWGAYPSNSISFNSQNQATAGFTFVSPRRLVQLLAYNSGTTSTTVSLSCAGQPTIQSSIPAGQTVTLRTGWTGTCSSVTIASTNGWNTNFDELVLSTS